MQKAALLLRILNVLYRQSRWPRGLRRGSATALLLGPRVRIPSEEWMFVCCECCVLSGTGFCVVGTLIFCCGFLFSILTLLYVSHTLNLLMLSSRLC